MELWKDNCTFKQNPLVLHNRQGHSSVSQFEIVLLKTDNHFFNILPVTSSKHLDPAKNLL